VAVKIYWKPTTVFGRGPVRSIPISSQTADTYQGKTNIFFTFNTSLLITVG
jgi:hypothetical protein